MTRDDVIELLRTVNDPEIPDLSIVDLGMVESIIVTPERVHLTLRPTFIGCPALNWIRNRAVAVLHPTRTLVCYDFEHPWSAEDITKKGRQQLRAFGIAPPNGASLAVSCPLCGSQKTAQTSMFGATLCRSVYYCDACQQPFEAWKSI